MAFDGAYSVWLDLKQDRYCAIELAHTGGFHEQVEGWPEGLYAENTSCPRSQSSIAQLLKRRLLVELHAGRKLKGVTAAAASQPAGEICAPVLAQLPRIHPRHLCNQVRASIVAAGVLKWRGLETAVARLRRRQREGSGESGRTNADALSQLISIFAALRPLFFTSRDRCLLTALALSEFLAQYGVYPQCVIGVHARPFSAHCWLEHGNVVLNDTVERVRRYTPILRV